MKTFDHIGIAVKDLDSSNLLFEKLLGVKPSDNEIIPEQGVNVSFFKKSDYKIELISTTDSKNPVNKFLSKRGEGIHHIAFKVDNIKTEVDRLKKDGFIPVNEKPIKGADNKIVVFFHPRTTNGVLIEICEEIK
ncbi:MAG: methylmalonyl-CoA epimerase [Bacteroidota bacterium]|nr:methylmalonyl-CoA epimerase [Bacteroidota bacterium]